MGARERQEEPDVIESEIKLLLYYYISIRVTDAMTGSHNRTNRRLSLSAFDCSVLILRIDNFCILSIYLDRSISVVPNAMPLENAKMK